MSIRQIAKTIYAPHKMFKEIIQKPRYLGPLLIMILFAVANIGWGYAYLSKRYIDQTAPAPSELGKDKWTENSAFWSSNVQTTNNTGDYVNGTYCGSTSIEFQSNSSFNVWMQLNISGSLDCSEQGYRNLTFSVKMVCAESPSNVSLYLFSTNPEDKFYYNLTSQLDAVNVWKNITVSLGSQEWKSNGDNADWSNITSLMFNFTWRNVSDITLLVDGLFFHGLYKSLMETDSAYLFVIPINVVMQFIIQCGLLGTMLYLIPKIFKLRASWKTWFIVAGFTLVPLIIQTIAFAAVSLVSSDFYLSIKSIGGVPGGEPEAYIQTFAPFLAVIWVIDKVVWVWIIALCAIALKLMFGISWLKSFLVAVPSYLTYVLVFLLFACYPVYAIIFLPLVPGAVILFSEWELVAFIVIIIVCLIFGLALSRKPSEIESSQGTLQEGKVK
ncbi:MAG: hypothetical protein QW270_01725 [Candidatus Bathyarchaeia archaeon]